MRRRLMLFIAIVAMSGIILNTSYGAFGTETWTATIHKVECSVSGSGAISGEVNPVGGSGAISGSGTVVYAHYAARIKSCPGWAWGCYDQGAVPEITNLVPTQPCPGREAGPSEVVEHT